MSQYEWKYDSLRTQDPAFSNEEGVVKTATEAPHERRWRLNLSEVHGHRWLYLLHVLLFTVSITLGALALSSKNSCASSEDSCPKCYVDDEQCTIHMSATSPVIDAGVVTSDWRMLNNNQNDSSLYRGPPTYDREKAWETLESRTTFNLPYNYLERLGKTQLQQKAKSSPSVNGGYVAFLEVRQQLQCLASLRRWIYKDDYVSQMGDLPETFHNTVVKVHEELDTCIELLRQVLLCNADTTPVLLLKDESSSDGYTPDLETKHKCRNWDSITKWEEDNKVLT